MFKKEKKDTPITTAGYDARKGMKNANGTEPKVTLCTCRICGQKFYAMRNNSRYCSVPCRTKGYLLDKKQKQIELEQSVERQKGNQEVLRKENEKLSKEIMRLKNLVEKDKDAYETLRIKYNDLVKNYNELKKKYDDMFKDDIDISDIETERSSTLGKLSFNNAKK